MKERCCYQTCDEHLLSVLSSIVSANTTVAEQGISGQGARRPGYYRQLSSQQDLLEGPSGQQMMYLENVLLVSMYLEETHQARQEVVLAPPGNLYLLSNVHDDLSMIYSFIQLTSTNISCAEC